MAIRSELTSLHREAAALLTDVLHVKPSLLLVLRRRRIEALEDKLDAYVSRFVALDAELLEHANAPADINTALRHSAHFAIYTAVRNSVRALLTDTAAASGSLRSRLDFLGSLLVSLVALVVAVIALFI